MLRILFHLSGGVWLLHAVLGSCVHHTHPGAELFSQVGESRAVACLSHARHHDHGKEHGHHHPHGPSDHQNRPVEPSPSDHSCPAHHHNDDGSAGFLTAKTPPPVSGKNVAALWVNAPARPTIGEFSARQAATGRLPDRGPPQPIYLLCQALLI